MKKTTVFLLSLTGITMAFLPVKGQVTSANDILGFWLNEEKDAKIEITIDNGKFFGKVVWLEEPNEDTGLPKVDDQNPEPSLQHRPIMGLEILKNFVFDEDEWNSGTIYDPDNGKTYKCTMKKGSETVLNIRGYIGKEWMGLGRTTIWTRP
ncbi:MAG: DUF2147 domain-containing protein [Bacteroidales bacterium]|nr:DUF2147 domain-containing protein [Lentimicrobiaceae bacterium]MDD5694380.1 DUF2147 domain-containing protein [Bacteroidales bacterium]